MWTVGIVFDGETASSLRLVRLDQAKVGLLEQARGSLGDNAGDLAVELPSIRLPTHVDRLSNERLVKF